jgi:hypothetical protein
LSTAKAFIDFFFADESAQAVLDLSDEINYDPPNKKSLELPSDVDPTTRATCQANRNAMLVIDVEKLRAQQRDIDQAWQERIAREHHDVRPRAVSAVGRSLRGGLTLACRHCGNRRDRARASARDRGAGR